MSIILIAILILIGTFTGTAGYVVFGIIVFNGLHSGMGWMAAIGSAVVGGFVANMIMVFILAMFANGRKG